MTTIKVQSRSLSSVAYQTQRKMLRIEFITGKVYSYFGVPEKTYDDLLKAESKGRYFNRWIRDRFPYAEEDSSKSEAGSG